MKLIAELGPAPLFRFLERQLPPSMVAKRYGSGYGYTYRVYARGTEPKWFGEGDPLATIHGNEITLHHPQYLSDFEDMAHAYETKYQQEVTIRYPRTQ